MTGKRTLEARFHAEWPTLGSEPPPVFVRGRRESAWILGGSPIACSGNCGHWVFFASFQASFGRKRERPATARQEAKGLFPVCFQNPQSQNSAPPESPHTSQPCFWHKLGFVTVYRPHDTLRSTHNPRSHIWDSEDMRLPRENHSHKSEFVPEKAARRTCYARLFSFPSEPFTSAPDFKINSLTN